MTDQELGELKADIKYIKRAIESKANKWVETVMKTMLGTILLAVLGAVLGLVISGSVFALVHTIIK